MKLMLLEQFRLWTLIAATAAMAPRNKYQSILLDNRPSDLKIKQAMVTDLNSRVVTSQDHSATSSYRGFDSDTSSEVYMVEKARRAECGFCKTNMTKGSEGELQSPNFPGRYGANVDCLWLLSGEPGSRIVLSCDEIHLESCGVAGPLAPNWRDVLIVSPLWTFKKSWVYCGRATKDIKAIKHTSICHRMAVTFRSNDNHLQYMGFHCSYKVI